MKQILKNIILFFVFFFFMIAMFFSCVNADIRSIQGMNGRNLDINLLGISTIKYSSTYWEEHGYSGYTTYRVYANFDMTTDYLAIFGGLNDSLEVYSTDGIFYNDLTYPSIRPPEDHTDPPEEYYANLWDTYLTIDCTHDCDGIPSFVPSEYAFAQLTNNLAGNFMLSDENMGAWYANLYGVIPPPLNILIGQFTVLEGERIGGYLNIQDGAGNIYRRIPFGLELADINDDTYVNVLDLLEVLSCWGETGGIADINDDGIVNILDLQIVLANWS